MQQMPADEWKRFLMSRIRTAKVAVVRRDGRPHVVPVWFDLDGDTIIFMTGPGSIKGAALRRDPRLCLCFDDEQRPLGFVTIEGNAAISTDLTDLRYWAGRIGGRYMGADRVERYADQNGVPGELLVRVTPTRVVGEFGVGE